MVALGIHASRQVGSIGNAASDSLAWILRILRDEHRLQLYLAELHIRSRRVTIQKILVERIAAFDFDVSHIFREGGITDQGENQIIEVFESVVGMAGSACGSVLVDLGWPLAGPQGC